MAWTTKFLRSSKEIKERTRVYLVQTVRDGRSWKKRSQIAPLYAWANRALLIHSRAALAYKEAQKRIDSGFVCFVAARESLKCVQNPRR